MGKAGGFALGGTNMVGKWEPLLTCLKNSSKNNVKVAWYWNKKFLLLISLISRLFCSKGWSNYLVNWSDLFQKMVKLTLRLEWLERLEQVTKGQIYQPYLSTPGEKRDTFRLGRGVPDPEFQRRASKIRLLFA